jgi:hypothetical protein
LREEPDFPYLEEVFQEADEVFDIAVDLRRENCEKADVIAFQDLPRATALAYVPSLYILLDERVDN